MQLKVLPPACRRGARVLEHRSCVCLDGPCCLLFYNICLHVLLPARLLAFLTVVASLYYCTALKIVFGQACLPACPSDQQAQQRREEQDGGQVQGEEVDLEDQDEGQSAEDRDEDEDEDNDDAGRVRVPFRVLDLHRAGTGVPPSPVGSNTGGGPWLVHCLPGGLLLGAEGLPRTGGITGGWQRRGAVHAGGGGPGAGRPEGFAGARGRGIRRQGESR